VAAALMPQSGSKENEKRRNYVKIQSSSQRKIAIMKSGIETTVEAKMQKRRENIS
jgi:hypothetical protein